MRGFPHYIIIIIIIIIIITFLNTSIQFKTDINSVREVFLTAFVDNKLIFQLNY